MRSMAGLRRSGCIRGAFSILSSSDVKRSRRRAFFQTKFLGAYCHCSEDGSLHAGCSMNFTGGKHQKGIKTLLYSIPEAGLGNVFHLEDPQLVLTPGSSVLPVTEHHCDIYMDLEKDFQKPVEIIVKETAAFPSKLVESREVSQRSGTAAESECPSPMETESSRSVGFLETPITAALQQCNSDLCEESKRFQF